MSIRSAAACAAASVKQAAERGPIGTALGMLTGSMVGLLAGPVGLAVGASLGGLTGLIFDLNKSGIDVQFVDDVSKALTLTVQTWTVQRYRPRLRAVVRSARQCVER